MMNKLNQIQGVYFSVALITLRSYLTVIGIVIIKYIS